MVKPVLLYASEIWGFKISDAIENVQYRFCKRFLKLPIHTAHILLEVTVEDIRFTLTIIVDTLSIG